MDTISILASASTRQSMLHCLYKNTIMYAQLFHYFLHTIKVTGCLTLHMHNKFIQIVVGYSYSVQLNDAYIHAAATADNVL